NCGFLYAERGFPARIFNKRRPGVFRPNNSLLYFRHTLLFRNEKSKVLEKENIHSHSEWIFVFLNFFRFILLS
ncbi:MAG: hypothetical protein IJ025_02120, partial [Clostridia bacterium]|nr:hypothetical protein [Clostridia bacterium]